MRRRRWSGIVVVALLAASTSFAEEACKPVHLTTPALSLAEVFATADAKAKAWKADAVPARLGNTILGPLDAKGRSTDWALMFYSPSADARLNVTTFRGTLTCYADPGSAGRLPDLKPDFFRDGAKLYALAKEHGGDLIAGGFAVMIQTAAAPSDRHATWYITFSQQTGKNGGVSVIVDADTGAVEQVIHDD